MISIISRYKTSLGAAILLLGLASCSNEDYLGGHYTADGAGTQMMLSATIQAFDGETPTFAKDAAIAVSTNYGGTDKLARNRKYTITEGTNNFSIADSPIYIKGNSIVVANYPFSGTEQSETSLSISTADQNNIKPLYLAESDSLNIGVQNLTLNFYNAYAKMNVTCLIPEGETLKSCLITGLAQSADINMYTHAYTTGEAKNQTVALNGATTFPITVVPQTISAESPVTVTLIGKYRSYTANLTDLTSIQSNEVITVDADVRTDIVDVKISHNQGADGRWNPATGAGGDITSHSN